MSAASRRPLAVILGCAGPDLGAAEARFFHRADPLGFILFARNCVSPRQVRRLVRDLRASVGRADAPVLIDQEGGRVARLRPPHWRALPAALSVAALADRYPARVEEAAWLHARLIAHDLLDLGITVDCAPVLDVLQDDTDPAIGDRAWGRTPEVVARLGRAVCRGLLAGGLLPVIKHMPGHGRATADSHVTLPVVSASRSELETVDLIPFRALNAMPWGFTAHVVYEAFDRGRPGSASKTVIEEVIRRRIGFDGVLMCDDLGMGALAGDFGQRTAAVLAAGCDLAVHCSGNLDEMRAVLAAARPISPATTARLARGEALRQSPSPFDPENGARRLEELMVP